MKVAIIHYWLVSLRGGEKVVQSLLKLYPDADIYTLFADPNMVQSAFPHNKVYSCAFDTPFFRRHYQKLFPLYPLFLASLKLRRKYDLIVSSESGPAKGIRRPADTPHACYVHTPMRYAWGFTHEYLRVLPAPIRPVAAFFFRLLRLWDKRTIHNVDAWMANSRNVANRIRKYYGKEATVIYPPIDNALFAAFPDAQRIAQNKGKRYFLCFGALVPYKRIDLAVKCFNDNGLPLEIYGTGSEFEQLKQIAGPNVRIHGRLEDNDFLEVISQSRALIFPGEEDFGMIPVEVMALGIPVIAFGKGGALETVMESEQAQNSTGIFFREQSVASMQKAVQHFLTVESEFSPENIHSHAQAFSEEHFLARVRRFMADRFALS